MSNWDHLTLADVTQICINIEGRWKNDTFREITYIYQLIVEMMNVLIFITFIKLFSAIIAMPEGQLRIQATTGHSVPLQPGGVPPLPPAQVKWAVEDTKLKAVVPVHLFTPTMKTRTSFDTTMATSGVKEIVFGEMECVNWRSQVNIILDVVCF